MVTSAALSSASLHSAMSDPVLQAMNFLNEVAIRHPDAISFAAGAPHEDFFTDVDIGRYLRLFELHLADNRGLDAAQRRRLMYQYGPSRGIINDLIVAALRRDEGIDVPEQAVVITVGCQEAMFLTLRVLHPPASCIGVWGPAYVGIVGAARLLDLGVVPVPDGGETTVSDRVARAVETARAAGQELRTVYVAPDFANPSGERLSLQTRHELLHAAEELDVILLEDNTYGFTAAEDSRMPTLKALDSSGRVVHFGTFAKTALPGARVGFAVADQRVGGDRLLADEIASAKSMVTVNTSPICQALIGGMILANGGSLAELGRAKALRYRANLARLLSSLDHHLGQLRDNGCPISWNEPKGGFFVRLRLPVPADEALLDLSAREFRVLWTPMRTFHLGRAGDHELRLSCSALNEKEIDEGVARLSSMISAVVA